MKLNDLRVGEIAVINEIDENIYGIERLKELGFTKNSRVKVIRYSPFNDPMIINLRGCNVCIRVNVANKIGVIKIEKDMSNRKS